MFFVFLSIIVIKVNKHILLKKLISCPGYWHFDFHWFSSKNTKEMFSYFKIKFWRLKRHFWGLCRSFDPPTYGVYLGGSKKQNNFLKIFFKLENCVLSFFEILCIFWKYKEHNPQKCLFSLQKLILKYENISFVFFEENQWKSKC